MLHSTPPVSNTFCSTVILFLIALAAVVQQSGVGTTEQEQVGAYTTWVNTAINSGVQGIIQYQVRNKADRESISVLIFLDSGVKPTSQARIQPLHINPELVKQASQTPPFHPMMVMLPTVPLKELWQQEPRR
jgi:hypothetical protein